MRHIVGIIVAALALTGCERIPVYAVKLDGSQLEPLVEYRDPSTSRHPEWDRYWGFDDDWHRVFVQLRAKADGLALFVRAFDDIDSQPYGSWSGPDGRPLYLTATVDCPSSVQYFDRAENAYMHNFNSPGYPDIYPYAAETSAPDISAILVISDCDDPRASVRIQVLDDDGAVAREYEFGLQREQIDRYYNIPLFE